MLTALKDDDGKVIAYCEWRLVGPSGYEVPNGQYIWINDIWVWPGLRNTGRIKRIIDEIMRLAPDAKYGYFQRLDYNTKIRIFPREQFERRRMIYDFLRVK